MSSQEYDVRRMNDDQIVGLLSLGLESASRPGALVTELQRLMGLSASKLQEAVRNGLRLHDLSVNDGARLLGANELTVRRWFESTGALSENARAKLAALSLLLSLAGNKTRRSRTGQTVLLALAALCKTADGGFDVASGDAARIVTSVFDAAGLMAAALHLALTEEHGTTTVEEE
jgi:hypothetical protein